MKSKFTALCIAAGLLGSSLAFAVTRYDGRVVISPTSCRELMPDSEAFALCLRDSFQEYLALAASAPRKRRGAGLKAGAAGAAGKTPAPRGRVKAAAPRVSVPGRRSRPSPAA